MKGRNTDITTAISHRAHLGVELCTEKKDEYQAAASVLMLSKKKNKIKKNPTTFTFSHSHWTSCEFYNVDFRWAGQAYEGRTKKWRMEMERALEGILQEKKLGFYIWKKLNASVLEFWRPFSLFSSFDFVDRSRQVWRSLNVWFFKLDVRMEKRKERNREWAKWRNILAALSQRLKIHLVHCVFLF